MFGRQTNRKLATVHCNPFDWFLQILHQRRAKELIAQVQNETTQQSISSQLAPLPGFLVATTSVEQWRWRGEMWSRGIVLLRVETWRRVLFRVSPYIA